MSVSDGLRGAWYHGSPTSSIPRRLLSLRSSLATALAQQLLELRHDAVLDLLVDLLLLVELLIHLVHEGVLDIMLALKDLVQLGDDDVLVVVFGSRDGGGKDAGQSEAHDEGSEG